MESFLVSTGTVALGEIGDKTQLLALLLATRFKRPLPIILGILVATLANHAVAAHAGSWVSAWLAPEVLRWILGLSFLAVAIWVIVPDKADDTAPGWERFGAFGATTITFFLAEIGDKTQVATVMLAAKYPDTWSVIAGTTLGMMIADVPAIYFGEAIAARMSLRVIRAIAAIILAVLGILVLLEPFFTATM